MIRNRTYGRIRRKPKKESNNNFIINNQNKNNFKTNNNIEPKYFNNNYKTLDLENPLRSRYNTKYSTFKKLKHNKNSDLNNYFNTNKENNIEYNKDINQSQKINPIYRHSKSKSAISHINDINNDNNNNELLSSNRNHDDDLLCQDCINAKLIEEKNKQKEMYRNINRNSTPEIFEDKNKLYAENLIKEKINRREKNIKEAYKTLERYQELNTKEKLIQENENAPNPLYEKNNNYLYDNFRTKYDIKQKYIKENYNKFQNLERPEISKYFSSYINNPSYKPVGYGEYKPKLFDIENYKKDLNEQINYKRNEKIREREEDKINEDLLYNNEKRKIDLEKKENEIKKKKLKDELIKGNLDLIREKKNYKEKIKKEEDLKYRQLYEKQNMEYNNRLINEKNKKNKIYNEFLMENNKYLNRIKKDKEQQMIDKINYKYDDNSYEPKKEITEKCCRCNKIYPKKLLTKNSSVFRNYEN